MKTKSKIFPKIFLLFCMAEGDSMAGAYPLEKGRMFFQVTGKYVYAENFYDAQGNKQPLAATSELTNNIFGEVGLSNRFSVIFNISFYKYFVTQGPNDKSLFDILYSGPGDSEFGAKYGIYRDKLVEISSWAKLGLPTSELTDGSGRTQPHIPLNSNDSPFYLGFDLETHTFAFPLTTGMSFGFKARSYTQKVNAYSDATVFGLKATYPIKRVFVVLSGYGEFSHWNGAVHKDVSYFAFGPQIYTRLEENIGLTLGVESAVFKHNTLSGLAYKAGLYLTY